VHAGKASNGGRHALPWPLMMHTTGTQQNAAYIGPRQLIRAQHATHTHTPALMPARPIQWLHIKAHLVARPASLLGRPRTQRAALPRWLPR
jgi:hypothetical protein